MESFLEQLLMVMPAIRVDIFVQKTRPVVQETTTATLTTSPTFECVLKKENIRATAQLVDGEFVVQAGSGARLTWIADRSEKNFYWKTHDKLVEQGVLKPAGEHNTFTENYAFSSASVAGSVVNGRSTPGPVPLKVVGTGQTYKDWEAENLEE